MPLTPLTLMFKINLWMQCKVPQIRLRVLQSKASSRSYSSKSSSRSCSSKSSSRSCTNDNVQVGQNVPVQLPQQPVPAQPDPTGLVVPAPKVFYQNWIGKKPEFSGKPEDDAESHLLSTRDWMEAHNFPNEVKVRHFHLTLIGEAWLWYELLVLLR